MKIGMMYDLRNPPDPRWFVPWPDFYAEALEHIVAMEQLGFESVCFAEDHFDPDGYVNAVGVLMGAVAVKTRRMLIGQNIFKMPFWNPVRAAEDIAAIDILSNGRVFLNAGIGGRVDQFVSLGIPYKQRASRTEEALQIVLKCFTEDGFSFDGRYWQLRDIYLRPRPVQEPHPPLFVVANTSTSMAPLERAVRMGLHANGNGGNGKGGWTTSEVWERWYGQWQAKLAEYGRDPTDYMSLNYGSMFCCEDPEREWSKYREALLYGEYYAVFDGSRPYGRAVEARAKAAGREPVPEDVTAWETIFMTPDDCIKKLREVYGRHSPTHLLLWGTRPGIPFSQSLEYHRLFARKVLPHVADL